MPRFGFNLFPSLAILTFKQAFLLACSVILLCPYLLYSLTPYNKRDFQASHKMEVELLDNALSPERDPVHSTGRKLDKDEAVLARFGKRQQLRVSTSI